VLFVLADRVRYTIGTLELYKHNMGLGMTSTQTTVSVQPFLKWAGGKGQLLEQYERFFPDKQMSCYYEPFVGSGAVFFRLRGRELFQKYCLSDINEELINCYVAVRDQVDDLIAELERHKENHEKNGAEYYYDVRNWDRAPSWLDSANVIRAARMIYLNKTCYNGLWRVNSKGEFNVPMGSYKKPDILNEERLYAASQALQGAELAVQGFQQAVAHAGSDDFVYFDPPYDPLSDTANFTSYSADSFGQEQQELLANTFADLASKGSQIMLSNSDTLYVRRLYASLLLKTLRIERVEARRAINSHAGKRGVISEIVVLNY
jgi:DNA adenine methylase